MSLHDPCSCGLGICGEASNTRPHSSGPGWWTSFSDGTLELQHYKSLLPHNPSNMPPRLNFCAASRSLARRTRPSYNLHQPRILQITSRRGFADERTPKPATGPNQDVLGHVSEEAVDISKVTGETEPDLGQGTPVQEVYLSIKTILEIIMTSAF